MGSERREQPARARQHRFRDDPARRRSFFVRVLVDRGTLREGGEFHSVIEAGGEEDEGVDSDQGVRGVFHERKTARFLQCRFSSRF